MAVFQLRSTTASIEDQSPKSVGNFIVHHWWILLLITMPVVVGILHAVYCFNGSVRAKVQSWRRSAFVLRNQEANSSSDEEKERGLGMQRILDRAVVAELPAGDGVHAAAAASGADGQSSPGCEIQQPMPASEIKDQRRWPQGAKDHKQIHRGGRSASD